MVPAAGLEPARDESPQILSLLCLPFHHAGLLNQLYIMINNNQGKINYPTYKQT